MASRTRDLGLDERELRALHRRVLEARRRAGLGTEGVTYERFVRSVERMMPALRAKARGGRITFDVVLKDGRVGLKPRILKES